MRTDFDLYVRRDSLFHRLDPRVKLAFVAEATLLVFMWPAVWMSLLMLALCTALLWAARIPPARIGQVWRNMGALSLLVLLLTVLFGGSQGTVLLQLGPLKITAEAVEQGLFLASRLLALALIFACWLFTTDQASMVRGFVALGMPYEWGLTLALALRYLPAFAGLFEQVRQAQQARGLDLDAGHFVQRLRAHEPVLVAMIIAALRNSERLGWALEARALGAHGVRRTALRSLHLAAADWASLALLGLVLAAAIALRVL